MILHTESMARENGEIDLIGTREAQTKTYLYERWQETLNLMGSMYDNATVICFNILPEGYEPLIMNDHADDYYNVSRIYETRGMDFIDLIRGYGRMIMIEDALTDERVRSAKELELGYRTQVGMPIYNEYQEITGIFMMLIKEPQSIENDDVRKITWLSTGIEESLKYLNVEHEIEQIRNIDPLTRLVSREKMMAIVKTEFDRSMRSSMPFSMVLIDIDNFKSINETFGHEAGDRVLREFSELILSRIRMVDTACRWDGNAFAILCPQTEMIGANQLVNDLFSNLTHHIFPNVGRCYFSMGIADYSPEDLSVSDMLLRLDKALYRVKAFGGNSHVARYHQ